MDERAFDALVQRIAQLRLTRLTAVRGVAASALTGVIALPLPDESDAKGKRTSGKHRRKNHGKGRHNRGDAGTGHQGKAHDEGKPGKSKRQVSAEAKKNYCQCQGTSAAQCTPTNCVDCTFLEGIGRKDRRRIRKLFPFSFVVKDASECPGTTTSTTTSTTVAPTTTTPRPTTTPQPPPPVTTTTTVPPTTTTTTTTTTTPAPCIDGEVCATYSYEDVGGVTIQEPVRCCGGVCPPQPTCRPSGAYCPECIGNQPDTFAGCCTASATGVCPSAPDPSADRCDCNSTGPGGGCASDADCANGECRCGQCCVSTGDTFFNPSGGCAPCCSGVCTVSGPIITCQAA